MRTAALVTLGAIAACGRAEPTPATPVAAPIASSPSSTMHPLSIKLLASPTRLAMADRAAFSIGVEVTNRGSANVDPDLVHCTLTVNGERAMSWSMAIGNGTRESTWYDLPPGKTATMSWPLGDELFEKPGDYHLVIALAGQESTADITVTR
jgi:hypothetical protein